jgi:hypothetical protein
VRDIQSVYVEMKAKSNANYSQRMKSTDSRMSKTYASRVSEWRMHSLEMRHCRTPDSVHSESKRIFLGPVPVVNRQ